MNIKRLMSTFTLCFYTTFIYSIQTMQEFPTICLTPPTITSNNVYELVTCIRPKHKNGFQVYGEIKNGKLIMHNYGHGGAGWTQLFGSVQKMVQEFEKKLIEHPEFKGKSICIIGAGCMGLYSAILLTQKGYKVKIVAHDFYNLTSHKAAGIFFPSSLYSTAQNKEVENQVNEATLQEYCAIINGTHQLFTSEVARFLPVYVDLETDYSGLDFWREPEFVTIDFGTGKKYSMKEYITIYINAVAIMQQLHRHVQALNIPTQQEYIASFDQIPDHIIINCSGLGAQQLNNDAELYPVQGHLITLKNQPNVEALNYILHTKVIQDGKEEWVYFVPKGEGLLGVTFLVGEASLDSNKQEFDRILERAQEYFGSYTNNKR